MIQKSTAGYKLTIYQNLKNTGSVSILTGKKISGYQEMLNNYGIAEQLSLENTSKIIESNC